MQGLWSVHSQLTTIHRRLKLNLRKIIDTIRGGRCLNELEKSVVNTQTLLAQLPTIIFCTKIPENVKTLIPIAILWSKNSLNNKIVAISTTK